MPRRIEFHTAWQVELISQTERTSIRCTETTLINHLVLLSINNENIKIHLGVNNFWKTRHKKFGKHCVRYFNLFKLKSISCQSRKSNVGNQQRKTWEISSLIFFSTSNIHSSSVSEMKPASTKESFTLSGALSKFNWQNDLNSYVTGECLE